MAGQNESDDSVWLLIAVPLGIVLLLAIFLIPWPSATNWVGTKPPVEVFALILTPLGALAAVAGLVINAMGTRRTLGLNRAIQIATNFQRGAEMLDAGAASSRIAGIEVLRQVAAQDPKTYYNPVVDTLAHFIDQEGEPGFHKRRQQIADDEIVDAVDSVLAHAVSRLCRIVTAKYAREDAEETPPDVVLNFVALTRYQGRNYSISFAEIGRLITHLSDFTDGFFIGSELSLELGRGVTFERCSFMDTTLTATRIDGMPLEPSDVDILEFVNCTHTDTATINGRKLTAWIRASRRRPKKI